MELRRIGDALLRSHLPPWAFSTPALSSKCKPITYTSLNWPPRRHIQRPPSSSAIPTLRRSITTSVAKQFETTDAEVSKKPSSSIDWLSAGKGSTRLSSPCGIRSDERLLNKGNSADDLLSSINSAGFPRSSSNTFDISKMADPTPMFHVADLMQDINKNLHAPLPERPPMQLTPRTGRTVKTNANVDVGRAFKLLQKSCSQNKVKQDAAYQRFHERPGLKRKRLKSVRWRKRFMMGFKATLKRVQQLKAQGW